MGWRMVSSPNLLITAKVEAPFDPHMSRQSQVFRPFQKAKKMGEDFSSRGIMLQRVVAIPENALISLSGIGIKGTIKKLKKNAPCKRKSFRGSSSPKEQR